MFEYNKMKKLVGLLALTLLFCVQGYPQRQSQGSAAQGSGTETPARIPLHSPDIISDNLDRVAASADQILEVVNKEAGLMVEVKRLLAQDAGVSGQILEESDLTDVAVAERLRSDLLARVLATRLLQRYGYLVPRVNPDSDLEAEQKLVRQERAEILARAAQRRDSLGDTTTAGRNTGCDPRSVPECALPSSLPQDQESLPVEPTTPAHTPRSRAPLERAEDVPQDGMSRPDGTNVYPNQRSEYPASLGSAETVLTSVRNGTNQQLNVSPNMPGYGNKDNLSVPLTNQPDLDSFSSSQPEQAAVGSRVPRTGRSFEPYLTERNAIAASSVSAESVRMVRQRNPYANVPSLYDLYVQAASNTRPLERFGLDVFRKGEANPAYLPMDLPEHRDHTAMAR